MTDIDTSFPVPSHLPRSRTAEELSAARAELREKLADSRRNFGVANDDYGARWLRLARCFVDAASLAAGDAVPDTLLRHLGLVLTDEGKLPSRQSGDLFMLEEMIYKQMQEGPF